MSFKNYCDYYRNNPEGYWFKRKLYGWGWVPVTREGWLVILALIAIVSAAAKYFLVEGRVLEYFAVFAAALLAVLAVGYAKGEPPRWQWGRPRDPDSETG